MHAAAFRLFCERAGTPQVNALSSVALGGSALRCLDKPRHKANNFNP